MGDEVLAGLAPLVGVVLAGEDEGVDQPVAVDGRGGLVGVLLDDREEIGQEVSLVPGELGRRLAGGRGVAVPAVVVDRQAAGRGRRGARRAGGDGFAARDGRGRGGRLARGRGVPVVSRVIAGGPGQAACVASPVLWVFRNRSPSSRRAW
jgi:hypothetical protein